MQLKWTVLCQEAFDKVKKILTNPPILKSPEYTQEFKLFVDCSDVGAIAVLMQEGAAHFNRLTCYYSKKLISNLRRG